MYSYDDDVFFKSFTGRPGRHIRVEAVYLKNENLPHTGQKIMVYCCTAADQTRATVEVALFG